MNQWTARPISLRDRFYQKFKTDPGSGCWLWTGCSSDRYGHIKVDGKMVPAHRASWVIHVGEIGPGLEVCHKCDNGFCINPDHLFLGTHKENCDDRDRKGRNVNHVGSKHGQAKLTEDLVRQIRASDKSAYWWAKKLGMSNGNICAVKRRLIWKHI